jgi:hypothetical protein
MKTNTDDELNKMFREGLTNPVNHAEYREADWDDLEAMLDGRKKRRGLIFWLPLLGSVAAMLLLVLGYWMFKPTTTTNNTLVNHSGKHQPLTNTNKSDVLAAVPGAEDGKKNTTGSKGGGIQQKPISTKQKPLSVNGSSGLAFEKPYRESKSFLPLSKPVNNRHIAGHPIDTVAKYASIGDILSNPYSLPLDDDNDLKPAAIDQNTLNNALKTINSKYKTVVKKQTIGRPQFAFTVVAAPDITGVGSFSQSKIGGNFGLLFSAGIGKRFTVTTGAVYAKTPYSTSFADYHSVYKFKTDPQTVNADCRILDIPINVDYTVYNKSSNKISVGSGLSSYLMLKENYHYNYANAYTQGPTDYNISNQNKHFLGVLNLDVSYQRKLNSKFGIDVQPYMKVPLTGIGYSKLKLQTAGVAVGLSWNINSPHKP